MQTERRRCALGAFAAAGVALAGCTAGGAPVASHPAPPLPGTEACIFTVELYDWTVLDDTTLIVYAPAHRDPYLIKLFAPVFDLSFHQALGFEGVEHNGQLCRGDYVIVRGELPQRMSISAVRQLTTQQAKELIAAARRPPAAGAGAAAGASRQ